MSGEDFVKYFGQITIGYQIDNYKNNYKVVRGVQSWKYHLYQFDLKEGAHAWAGISFYNPRFYVKDCRVGQTAGYMILKKGSKILFRGGIYDIYPLNFKEIEDAEEGTYQLYVKVAWADGDKPDYTVRVVTNQISNITGDIGDPSLSCDMLHDASDNFHGGDNENQDMMVDADLDPVLDGRNALVSI